jgi:hypothetical protein
VNKERLPFRIFAGAGTLLLVIGLIEAVHTQWFVTRAARASGVVVENISGTDSEGSSTVRPQVRFRIPTGQVFLFISRVGSSRPRYEAGEGVPVLYDPENPGDARIQSSLSLWFVSLVFGGLGALFGAIGFIPMRLLRRRDARDEWLRLHGHRIQAGFLRVELNTAIEVNGSSPYRIVCQWLDSSTNQVHVFKSRNIWFGPAAYITGKTLDVMVDPGNYRRYVVETSFLPKPAK